MTASGSSAGNNRTRKRKRNRLRKRSLQIRKLAGDCILNDAGVTLGDDHLSVLCKGLRFVPNFLPVPPLTEDLTAFRRSINLKLHFSESYRSSKLGRILKSTWDPPQHLTENHSAWQDLVSDLQQETPPSGKHNLSISEKRAWRDLERREDIYIVKADKGGKIVLWSRMDYLKEANRQLADSSTYREVSEADFRRLIGVMSGIKAQLTQRLLDEKCITFSEAERMKRWEGSAANFYLMPKIHKEKREETGTFAGRPVVASCSAILRPFDEYLSATTAEIGKCFPGTLQDTTALILALEQLGPVPPGAVLFSADVESLYPSIPWSEGIEASTRFYQSKWPELISEAKKAGFLPPPSPELFKSILSSVITMNVFSFQSDRFFRQIKGTAMGCSISVFFANAFLYHRTSTLIARPPANLLYLGRYIDDLVGVATGKQESIPGMFTDVVDDSIKLTYVTSFEHLEALDLQLSLDESNRIVTKLFTKPTGGALFIPWDSGHPRKSKLGIVYSQLLRLRRNCSRLGDYRSAAERLIEVFKDRGYQLDFLRSKLEEVASLDRSSLLTRRSQKRVTAATFVTTFHPSRPGLLRNPLNKFWQRLRDSRLVAERRLRAGVPDLPVENPLVAFRLPDALGHKTGVPYKKGRRREKTCTPSNGTKECVKTV